MAIYTIVVPYIPEAHADALGWLERFHQAVALNPRSFGIDPRDVEPLRELIREYREILLVTAAAPAAPAARAATAGSGHEHDQRSGPAAAERIILARNRAVQAVQRMVRTVNANPLTSDEDRDLLGLPHAEGD